MRRSGDILGRERVSYLIWMARERDQDLLPVVSKAQFILDVEGLGV